MKPRALDLFCKAGGATKGLQRAGFYVTGVDIEPQKNYCGDEFYQLDALTLPLEYLQSFDLIWASPPCQAYTWSARRWRNVPRQDLIERTRERLEMSCVPYVIENVPGAPLRNYFRLCGGMFGLNVIRHRHFEPSHGRLAFMIPTHRWHRPQILIRGRMKSSYACVAGHGGEGYTYRLEDWQEAMGIDWMTKEELVEAVPPAYSEFIGKQALQFIDSELLLHP